MLVQIGGRGPRSVPPPAPKPSRGGETHWLPWSRLRRGRRRPENVTASLLAESAGRFGRGGLRSPGAGEGTWPRAGHVAVAVVSRSDVSYVDSPRGRSSDSTPSAKPDACLRESL